MFLKNTIKFVPASWDLPFGETSAKQIYKDNVESVLMQNSLQRNHVLYCVYICLHRETDNQYQVINDKQNPCPNNESLWHKFVNDKNETLENTLKEKSS